MQKNRNKQPSGTLNLATLPSAIMAVDLFEPVKLTHLLHSYVLSILHVTSFIVEAVFPLNK